MSDAIKGYGSPTEAKIALVNENKVLEELILRQVDAHVLNDKEFPIDQRWVAVARTHFHEGFMALNRSVFQPSRLEGDLDVSEIIKRLARQ